MLQLDGKSLDLAAFRRVVVDHEPCELAPAARREVEAARELVARLQHETTPIYGVTTGFGDLAQVRIPEDQLRRLQVNLLRSHSAGVGEPLPDAAVRGMLLLRANTLARGCSGVRPVVIERLLDLLDRDLLPVVPRRGSVGASGDLAQLAHLALPLIGEGRLRRGGVEAPAHRALAEAGLEPVELASKEGLALINGTQAMTSVLALAALESRRLVRVADLVGALTTEAMRGTDSAFDPRVHRLRPHPGQLASARNLWRLMRRSEIRESHRRGDPRVQDPYSVRCMPQVHGAARDVLAEVERRLEIELNSVTDNPLVFAADGDVVSGGNFHGEPMALAADQLALALAELGAISERRVEKLNNPAFSGLPPFLTDEPGINSGFMLAQVTAAALASDNKLLAHPASIDSIPTSNDREDHVSMGMGAALKLEPLLANVRQILAIELLAAAQGIDLLRPLTSSGPLEALHRAVREIVPRWEHDREMAPDLAACAGFLRAPIDPYIEGLE